MKIQRVCPFTKKLNEREIDVTPNQIYAWQNGQLIQNAMPNLSPADREFIMTGITEEVWNDTFEGEEA